MPVLAFLGGAIAQGALRFALLGAGALGLGFGVKFAGSGLQRAGVGAVLGLGAYYLFKRL